MLGVQGVEVALEGDADLATADVFTPDIGICLLYDPVILLVNLNVSTFGALLEQIELLRCRDVGVGEGLDLALVIQSCGDLETIVLLARSGVVFK